MDENISAMNKYSELYVAAVSSLVDKAQPTMVTSVPRITYFAIRYHIPSHYYRCYIYYYHKIPDKIDEVRSLSLK